MTAVMHECDCELCRPNLFLGHDGDLAAAPVDQTEKSDRDKAEDENTDGGFIPSVRRFLFPD